MKRLLIALLVALLCFSLCACQETESEPRERASAPTKTETPTEPSPVTEPSKEGTTTQPASQKVTVYLLDQVVMFDNGYTQYTYDSDYNIDVVKSVDIENKLRYTAFYEEKDVNGMFCKLRIQWADGADGDTINLTRFQDGKVQEELYDYGTFNGFQYEYDQKGDMTQKREYYDGILQSITYYEYDGETLIKAYTQDQSGNTLRDYRIENGRIVEKVGYDYDDPYSYRYKYDENGNLIEQTFVFEGEEMPDSQYSYKAVEVDSDRVWYLLLQQQYLLSQAF